MVAVGIPQEQIAACVTDNGIAVETLQKHFAHEIKTSAIIANAKIGGAAYNRAINGDSQMIKWWTATRMGWSEKQSLEVTGKDGEPIQNHWTVEFVNATPEGE